MKWKVEPDGTGGFKIIGQLKMVICRIINGETRASREKTANLIAAAPETEQQRDALLAALKQLQEAFVHIPDDMKGNRHRSGIIKHCENMRVALNVARSAIDKATT